MTRTDVQKLYRVAGGRWWDPFRAQGELLWARTAVRDLDSLFRRYVTPASKRRTGVRRLLFTRRGLRDGGVAQ